MIIRRFRPLLAIPAAGLLALGGCGKPAPEATASADATTTAPPSQGPTAAPGITLTDARVQLPLVHGAPGVAYFTLTQGAGAPRKLAAIDVAGVGRAEMHATMTAGGVSRMEPLKEVAIEPGKSLAFAPGGNHVMLFDIDPKLKAGSTTELTVTLDNGDKASARASVAAGPPAMDHAM